MTVLLKPEHTIIWQREDEQCSRQSECERAFEKWCESDIVARLVHASDTFSEFIFEISAYRSVTVGTV
jgi:hypothetical protein